MPCGSSQVIAQHKLLTKPLLERTLTKERSPMIADLSYLKGMDWGPQMGNLKNRIGIYLPGSFYSYFPTILLRFPICGVPISVPLLLLRRPAATRTMRMGRFGCSGPDARWPLQVETWPSLTAYLKDYMILENMVHIPRWCYNRIWP